MPDPDRVEVEHCDFCDELIDPEEIVRDEYGLPYCCAKHAGKRAEDESVDEERELPR